jgi:hypothetical protein
MHVLSRLSLLVDPGTLTDEKQQMLEAFQPVFPLLCYPMRRVPTAKSPVMHSTLEISLDLSTKDWGVGV